MMEPMRNLADELSVLKNAADMESMLRQAASVEWANGIQNGPMRQAHDAAIQAVLDAARRLLAQADAVDPV